MNSILRLPIVLALCAVPFGLGAQQSPSAGHAVLQGVVVDSVRGGVLRGATVGVLGPSRMTFTDSLGRFRIDSIPPGEYRVALFDPLLDTLSLGVTSAPTRFAAGDTVSLVLAIPSQSSIIAAKCGPARSPEEDRALFGQVLDAATEQPVAGAQVSLSWTDLTIGEESGIQTEPRRRHSETDGRGYYKICGLPSDLTAEAFVQRGADSTGKVQLVFGEALLGVATFLLPGGGVAAADTVPTRAGGTTTLLGTVVDIEGKPIDNAHVSITGGPDATTTDSTGTFRLAGQPSGTRALVVRRLGYTPVELPVNLSPLRENSVAIQLEQYVPMLATVVIEGQRQAALERVGFTRRKATGAGRYIERADIERRNPHRLSNILETVPAVTRPGDGFGGTCVRYFVDEIEWRGQDTPEDYIMPNEIEAIEVYTRGFTPAIFLTERTCTTVVIWTRWKLKL